MTDAAPPAILDASDVDQLYERLATRPAAPAAPVAADIRTESCGTCRCYHRISPSDGQCRAGKPTALLLPLPGVAGGITVRTYSDWPPVKETQWCVTDYTPLWAAGN